MRLVLDLGGFQSSSRHTGITICNPQDITLQGTNISHQWERKLIFPTAFGWDMLVPSRVTQNVRPSLLKKTRQAIHPKRKQSQHPDAQECQVPRKQFRHETWGLGFMRTRGVKLISV